MLIGTESAAQECEICGHGMCKDCNDWVELVKVYLVTELEELSGMERVLRQEIEK